MTHWTDPEPHDRLNQTADYRLSRPLPADPDDPAGGWWSVLLILDVPIDTFIARSAAYTSDLIVPNAYDAQDRQRAPRAKGLPVTVFARKRLIDQLNAAGNGFGVVSLVLGAATPSRLLNPEALPAPTSQIDVAEDAVIMAVMDDGLGIGHEAFRHRDGTSRVEYAAILGARPSRQNPDATMGRSHHRHEIDALIAAHTSDDLFDDFAFYRATGQIDLAVETTSGVAYRRSHGTHVAALAAGYDKDHAPDTRPIICVSLPVDFVEDTSGTELLPALYLGFHMLVKTAARCRSPGNRLPPVVYNFSYGNNDGPHNGQGLYAQMFEYYFGADGLTETEQKSWLVLPAGNGNLGRLHGLADTELTRFDLSVQPDDRTSTEVQVWVPGEPQEPVNIVVTSPDGATGRIKTHVPMISSLVQDGKDEIARLSVVVGQPGTEKAALVSVNIHPTASFDEAPTAPAGVWTIAVERPAIGASAATRPEPVSLWVRRDDVLPGSKRGGRQAWLSNSDYERFTQMGLPRVVDPDPDTSPVRRSWTLSGFASGPSPIVVAAYQAREAQVSDYSATGAGAALAELSGRLGPDMTAKGDDSFVQSGVLSAGSYSGSHARMSGTSVAAPRVARAAAGRIASFQGTARDWARDPGLHSVDLGHGASPDRIGSGAYEIDTEALVDL